MLHKWSKVSRGHFLRCWCVWWCWPWWRGGWWEPTQRKGVRHHVPWKARSSPPSSALLPGHITIIIINIFSWESQWWRGWWKWQICLDVRWWQQDVLWWRQDVYQISPAFWGGFLNFSEGNGRGRVHWSGQRPLWILKYLFIFVLGLFNKLLILFNLLNLWSLVGLTCHIHWTQAEWSRRGGQPAASQIGPWIRHLEKSIYFDIFFLIF